MRSKFRQFFIGALFLIAVMVIALILNSSALQSEEIADPQLFAALSNLYYIPVLIAAMLLGESGGVIIALLATVVSSIATPNFSWPKNTDSFFSTAWWGGIVLTAWWAAIIRGAFYIVLAWLTGRIAERMRANGREWLSLLEISRSINASLDLDETLQSIVRISVELTSANACAVRLLSADSSELRYEKSWGLSDEFINTAPTTLEASPLIQRVLAGESIFTRDIRRLDSTPNRQAMVQEGIVSAFHLPLSTGNSVIGVLSLYRKRTIWISNRDLRVASAFAEQIVSAIQNARLYASIRENYLATVRALTRAIEAKDPVSLGHSERVTNVSRQIALALNLPPADLQMLEFGAMLHDIGKIGLDETMLSHPHTLSLDQEALLEMHPLIGKSIIEPVEFLRPCVPIVFSHHERWNGTGYPEGLAGEQIPLLTRIVSIANGFDHAMYPASGVPVSDLDAFSEVARQTEIVYDPELVATLGTIIQRDALPMPEAEMSDRIAE